MERAYDGFAVMNADREMRHYLESLLAHQCMSGQETCRACRSLQRVYELMQTEIFATVIYPETPIEMRHSTGAEKPRWISAQQP